MSNLGLRFGPGVLLNIGFLFAVRICSAPGGVDILMRCPVQSESAPHLGSAIYGEEYYMSVICLFHGGREKGEMLFAIGGEMGDGEFV